MAKHGVGVVIGYGPAIFIVLLSSIATAQKLVAHDDAEEPMFQAVSRSNLQGLVGEKESQGGTQAMTAVQTGSQKIETRIGTLEFTHDFANGYPTDATVEKLYDERDFQRACQAYL